MELIFDHILGKQENLDLVVCKPLAFIDAGEEIEALDTGWLALDHPVMNKEVFYQSRSTRVDLQKFKPRYKHHRWQDEDIDLKVIDASEMVSLIGLPHIYKQYIKRKNFKMDYTPFAHYHKRDQFMIFFVGKPNNIIGFTKQKKYLYQEDTIDDVDNPTIAGIESVIHANTVPISDITLDLELIWAQEHLINNCYLGSGYEKSSEYKANYKGFQWWTGAEWSTSKKQYRKLCRRDSKIQSLQDVSKIPSLLLHTS
jgi:hypothetical protein